MSLFPKSLMSRRVIGVSQTCLCVPLAWGLGAKLAGAATTAGEWRRRVPVESPSVSTRALAAKGPPPATDAWLAEAAPDSPVPTGRVDVVRILTVGKPARGQRENFARAPQAPYIVQDDGPALESPQKRLGPCQELAISGR